MRRACLAAAVLVLSLAGCGSSGPDPKAVASAYFTGLASGNYRQACKQLDPGLVFGISSAILKQGGSQSLDLIDAAGRAIPHGKSPDTIPQCVQLISKIMSTGHVQTGQLRFVKLTTRAQGKATFVQVGNLPDTSSLPADIAPSLLTIKSGRITQLGG